MAGSKIISRLPTTITTLFYYHYSTLSTQYPGSAHSALQSETAIVHLLTRRLFPYWGSLPFLSYPKSAIVPLYTFDDVLYLPVVFGICEAMRVRFCFWVEVSCVDLIHAYVRLRCLVLFVSGALRHTLSWKSRHRRYTPSVRGLSTRRTGLE